tara:strand:+ start:184 stop:600 length:417 start_codon:yes stop_codon:yes gene_type:complete
MNTLIKSIEEWVDQRVFANNEYFVTKFKEMEEIHIRDSNRIALLESRVQLYLDSPSPKADAGESMHEADQILSELVDRVDEMDSRIDEVYDEMHERLTADEVDERVVNAVADIDIESQIIDAVQSEIDAIDFKITVER